MKTPLAFVIVGLCLGAEQKPVCPPRSKKPIYQWKPLSESVFKSKDKDWRARKVAAEPWAVGPEAETAILALLGVRFRGAVTLVKIGLPAVPALKELLRDKEWFSELASHDGRGCDVRLSAVQALEKVGRRAEAAIPVLTELLQDKDRSVRIAASRAIESIMGPEAKAAVPHLTEALQDANQEVRRAAAKALEKIEKEKIEEEKK